jgi:uncharacterized protein
MAELIPSVACNLDVDILNAALPLFAESRVGAIEWAFDALYNVEEIPEWFTDLLQAYNKEGRLIGHGVFFSLFCGRWTIDQQKWLDDLKQLSNKYHFDHITEHFGFMTGASFHNGAPLNIPYSETTLAIGRDRLARISDACRCPVGLENLAFSYTIDEIKRHGEFLARLIEPINGFIILDLHNLYCQLHNFSVDFEDVINLYPLDRVREIHISGGSWEDSIITGRRIRRDTHDDSVPAEVFELLEMTIKKCHNLKYIVMEQLGTGLKSSENKKAYYDDFLKMESIVKKNSKARSQSGGHSFLPIHPIQLDTIIEDEDFYQQQLELSSILESAVSYQDAARRLMASVLVNSSWKIEEWEPHMLETAIKIAQKWKEE